MLSIANEVNPLIFRCVCFVCNTNHVFPTAQGAQPRIELAMVLINLVS